MTDDQGVSVKGAIKRGGTDGERVVPGGKCQNCGHSWAAHSMGPCSASSNPDTLEPCGCANWSALS